MAQRRKKSPHSRARARASSQLVVLGLIAVVVALGLYIIANPPSPGVGRAGAVVIDQLSPTESNESLRRTVRRTLDDYGLDVVEYEGAQVDVGLYRRLGLQQCSVLFIRSHAGLLVLEGERTEHITALFTNERYSRLKYVDEQIRDRVLIVRPFQDDADLTFGISPHFVAASMEGAFPSTVVIIAGCSCLDRTDLAAAFLARGASVVLSWDRTVGLDHLDAATAYLFTALFDDNLTVHDAVEATMSEYGADPQYGAMLTYFPLAAGRYTVDDLIG